MGCFSSKPPVTGGEFEEELTTTRRAPSSNIVVPGATPERGRAAQPYLERAANAHADRAVEAGPAAELQSGSTRYIAQPRTVVVGAIQPDAGRRPISANTVEAPGARSGHAAAHASQQQPPKPHQSTMMEVHIPSRVRFIYRHAFIYIVLWISVTSTVLLYPWNYIFLFQA